MLKLTLLIVLVSLSIGCHLSAASPSVEISNSLTRVKITQPTGDNLPIPVGNGLTIVNLFDEFSAGCPTGNRFEAMEHLHSLRPASSILLIFSEKHFSPQDIDNFKAILPMPESLVRGDIETIKPHLSSGKLLVVVDAKRNVIWYEKPGMSEEQIIRQMVQLIDSTSK